MTQRLLFVEQSATMRHVMAKHAGSLGFAVDACESFEEAESLLDVQFQHYGSEYSAVVYGWPTTTQKDAQAFSEQLENHDHKGLPVVVMSTDMRAETRAWVAARDSSALLSWKKYYELGDVLNSLIDDAPEKLLAPNGREEHRGVRLLIVDDSATIRYSLRDLFESQGYKVALAASHAEAMSMAKHHTFDVAVLDFYLSDTTGDVLCQELIASKDTGDIVCTILTGTYSDHIIKQSLSAGAIECMFKNESSSLLLARIDAISRLTKKTRQVHAERSLLESVLQNIAGAVILVGFDQKVVYVNPLAVVQLGLADANVLIGYPLVQLMGENAETKDGAQLLEATWRLPNGEQIDVDYLHSSMEIDGTSLVRFTPRVVPIETDNVTVLQQNNDAAGIVRQIIEQHKLHARSDTLLLSAQRSLQEAVTASMDVAPGGEVNSHVSLLLLDVFARDVQNQLSPVSSNPELAERVRITLATLLPPENHVCALTANRYAFLFRHKQQSQAYVVARKVMQRCLESSKVSGENQVSAVACTGSLLSLTQNSARTLDVLVQHAITGLELVNSRGPDQAILLDVRRLLNAYPAE